MQTITSAKIITMVNMSTTMGHSHGTHEHCSVSSFFLLQFHHLSGNLRGIYEMIRISPLSIDGNPIRKHLKI